MRAMCRLGVHRWRTVRELSWAEYVQAERVEGGPPVPDAPIPLARTDGRHVVGMLIDECESCGTLRRRERTGPSAAEREQARLRHVVERTEEGNRGE